METPRPEVTTAQVQRWMTELSNWGRWGKDDQLGTLNLITPQKRQQAQALAKRGVVVSLEQPVALVAMPEATKRDGAPRTAIQEGIHDSEGHAAAADSARKQEQIRELPREPAPGAVYLRPRGRS